MEFHQDDVSLGPICRYTSMATKKKRIQQIVAGFVEISGILRQVKKKEMEECVGTGEINLRFVMRR